MCCFLDNIIIHNMLSMLLLSHNDTINNLLIMQRYAWDSHVTRGTILYCMHLYGIVMHVKQIIMRTFLHY